MASGSGSNAEKIIQYFKNHKAINIACVITNNEKAGAIERAEKARVPSTYFSKEDFEQPNRIMSYLESKQVDYIVLAGFLLKIAPEIIAQYPDKIINIHPALLPKYGGKGMYGMNVHRAVKNNGDIQSGMTIHQVNEKYDDGDILFQAVVALDKSDTPESIAKKVLTLEHKHYPLIIEEYIKKQHISL